MADVLIAVEVWLLCAILFAWFVSRAAERLAGPEAVTVTEADMAAVIAALGPEGPHESSADGWGSLSAAVRLFDGV